MTNVINMSDNKIIDRILRKYNISGFDFLCKDMPLTDLQSLLIEIYSQRVKSITAKDILEQYKNNRFVKPSKLNPKEILDFTKLAFDMLPADFQLLELSPVCPLGSAAVVAPVSQNMILTTIRNTEVCSDGTNVMALEASLLRKQILNNEKTKFNSIKLCSTNRLLRTQLFENPLYIQHFQILSLCIAGRDEGNFKFELEALQELIVYYYNLISKYVFNNIAEKPKIKFTIATNNEHMLNKLLELGCKLNNGDDLIIIPKLNLDENWNYYGCVRFNIFLCDRVTNDEFFIADGGDTTWTAQLLSNKKERYMISGLGSKLLILKIKAIKNGR
jgi:hypothetical protein